MFKQTLIYSLAQLVGRILGFAIVVVAGNLLGPTTFGIFTNASTYLMVITIFSTFGLDLWLARHVANDAVNWRSFWGVVGWRLALSALMLAALYGLFEIGLIGRLLRGNGWSVAIILTCVAFDHIAMTAVAVLEGRRRLATCAKISLLRWSSFALAAIALLVWHPKLLSLALGLLLGSIARAIVALMAVRSEVSQQAPSMSRRKLLLRSSPMALLNFMIVLYFHVDMLMLPEMAPGEQTGWYKIAYTLVEALLFVSAGVASALFPLFSERSVPMEVKVTQLQRGLLLLSLLAFPVAWGTGLVAEELIALMFPQQPGQFAPAAKALLILVWSLPFMFMNATLVRFFLGTMRQNEVLWHVSATMILNIGLNFWLIPSHGFEGAALATVASESLLSLSLCISIRRRERQFQPWRPMVLGALLGAVVIPAGWLGAQVHTALIVPAAALAYFSLVWRLKLVTRATLSQFAQVDQKHHSS